MCAWEFVSSHTNMAMVKEEQKERENVGGSSSVITLNLYIWLWWHRRKILAPLTPGAIPTHIASGMADTTSKSIVFMHGRPITIEGVVDSLVNSDRFMEWVYHEPLSMQSSYFLQTSRLMQQ